MRQHVSIVQVTCFVRKSQQTGTGREWHPQDRTLTGHMSFPALVQNTPSTPQAILLPCEEPLCQPHQLDNYWCKGPWHWCKQRLWEDQALPTLGSVALCCLSHSSKRSFLQLWECPCRGWALVLEHLESWEFETWSFWAQLSLVEQPVTNQPWTNQKLTGSFFLGVRMGLLMLGSVFGFF
jgi:hypothetical protein